ITGTKTQPKIASATVGMNNRILKQSLSEAESVISEAVIIPGHMNKDMLWDCSKNIVMQAAIVPIKSASSKAAKSLFMRYPSSICQRIFIVAAKC
ncbi:MAG: hypothetical protein K2Z81_18305, partial [Cyanobacteria bacterium]|nr:hypothetical protein [Cyanobacteriota bacterium]